MKQRLITLMKSVKFPPFPGGNCDVRVEHQLPEHAFDAIADTIIADGFIRIDNTTALTAIHGAANLMKYLKEIPFFSELDYWELKDFHENCRIDERNHLLTNEGRFLSNDGRCMDEEIPYFVNQSVGYSGDDYSGKMFVRVDDKNTFVEIYYEC